MDDGLKDRQHIEVDWWRGTVAKSQQAGWMQSIIERIGEAKILLDKTLKFERIFAQASTILEIGAGECWGSCLIKHQYPSARVIASDISEDAIAGAEKWEYVFKTRLDETYACSSYQIPTKDESVDRVWCYEAAHHFVAHRRTLAEIYRVLAPGGTALYLREPSCRPYIHGIARRRVNRKRPDVPEDVLVYPKIQRHRHEDWIRSRIAGRSVARKSRTDRDHLLLRPSANPSPPILPSVRHRLRLPQTAYPTVVGWAERRRTHASAVTWDCTPEYGRFRADG